MTATAGFSRRDRIRLRCSPMSSMSSPPVASIPGRLNYFYCGLESRLALLQTLPGEVAKKETDHNNIMRSFPVCTQTSTNFGLNTSFERSLSKLSENHKIVDIGSKILKLMAVERCTSTMYIQHH